MSPESDTELESLTITTDRNVIIALSETADLETEVEGTITLDGTEYGVIEDRVGIPTIVHSDGVIQSL